MLLANTEEQRSKIQKILCIRNKNFVDDDMVFISLKHITYDQMAEIVDYLRGQKSIKLPFGAKMTFNSEVSEVNLKKTNPVEAKEFILSLGSMGFNTEELMQEYIKHGIIHYYGQK